MGKNKVTKVVRLELIYTDKNLDFGKFKYELVKLQNEVRAIKNKTIQILWEWNNYAGYYKKELQEYPKPAESMPCKTMAGNADAIIREQHPTLYSSNLSTAVRVASGAFEDAKKEMLRGEKSIIEYKGNCPIELHNSTIQITGDKNHYFCRLKLFSGAYSKELGLPNSSLGFQIQAPDGSQRSILDRCISGEYKISASKLIYNKKKKMWFLNLSYSFELKEDETLDKNRIMGVDLGINYAAAMSFNCCQARYFIDGGEISKFRHQIERRKKELQRQGKYCGDGRIGHGIHTRIKPLETLNDKIANFRDTVNHKYSRFIVDKAVENHCGTIQMENLKGIAGDDRFLKEWTYYDLRQKVEYKAKEKGIEVVLINPEYTSQRCSQCGFISAENRPKETKGQAYFKCIKCGFEVNADYNASQNIATKDIEKLIQKNKPQKDESEKD